MRKYLRMPARKAGLIASSIIALFGAGCATVPKMEFFYVYTDGRQVPPTGPEQDKFVQEKTVCAGEMSKAQMSGAVIPTGSIVADVGNEIERNKQAGNVMVGCMASKGYKFISRQVAAI